MKKGNCFMLVAAFGMMAATGGVLVEVHRTMNLGAPGVKVGPGLLYNETNHLVARQCVLLPESVLGMQGTNLPVTQAEVDDLPKDTTFGRKLYVGGNDFRVQTSVVLMGADRSSIHDPHYCLEAQAWNIEKTEIVGLQMDRPYPYELPALKLTASTMVRNELNVPSELKGIYVYWFVTDKKLAAGQTTRMWSLAKTMWQKRELERWAYISYFTTCLPGQEEATFGQLERVIRASVPEIQTVTGQPSAARPHVAVR